MICECYEDVTNQTEEDRANDAFIVRACNNFDEVLAALIDATNRLETCALFGGSDKECVAALIDQFRTVITKATA